MSVARRGPLAAWGGAEAGALPSVCGVIGGLMVGEALKLVTGTGEPLLGRVVVHDALRGSFRELGYERDPQAAPVTALIDYDLFCGVTDTMSPSELHARLIAGEPHTLLDVREPWEADIVELPGSLLVPLGVVENDPAGVAARLPADPLVIVCHHGIRAETADVRVGPPGVDQQRLVLGRSRSYMNETGGPVSGLMSYYKLEPSALIVIHDELDIDPTQLRVKLGGGDNGHNGLRSMRKSLDTGDFYRVRVGIGRPPGRQNPVDFVLKPFSPTERRELGVHVEYAADAVESLLTDGLVRTQSAFNS